MSEPRSAPEGRLEVAVEVAVVRYWIGSLRKLVVGRLYGTVEDGARLLVPAKGHIFQPFRVLRSATWEEYQHSPLFVPGWDLEVRLIR